MLCCTTRFHLRTKIFIMYTNDIFIASKLFKFVLFADDMNVLYCNNDINEIIQKTNSARDKLNVWFSVNRLSLSITKPNYMILGNRALKKYLSKK